MVMVRRMYWRMGFRYHKRILPLEHRRVTRITAHHLPLVKVNAMKPLCMTCAYILLACCVLQGQSFSKAILRIERVQPGEAICALVTDDGSYRLEKMFQSKDEFYEGTIDSSRLDNLRKLLANQRLSSLSQTDIHKPLMSDSADDLQLAIRRDAGWQELVFLSPASRKPFKDSLEPLLHWFQELQKQRPSATRVQGPRTSCMPPPENRLLVVADSNSPKTGTAPDFSGYFFRIYSGHYYHGRIDSLCTVVFGDGHFRRERGGQTYMQERHDKITEGQISSAAVDKLREIINSPAIKDSPDNPNDPSQWVIEGSWTNLEIPRKERVQKLLFETTFNTLNAHTDIGGKSNMQYRISDKKALDPLTRWMKEYTDKQSGTESEGVGNDCYPGKKIADFTKPAQ